jgi:hypothetical protein
MVGPDVLAIRDTQNDIGDIVSSNCSPLVYLTGPLESADAITWRLAVPIPQVLRRPIKLARFSHVWCALSTYSIGFLSSARSVEVASHSSFPYAHQ